MIFIEHGFRPRQIMADLGTLFPGCADQPVDVVAHHCCFSGHRRHHFQLVQLGQGLGLGLLAHAGLFDLVSEFIRFIGHVVHLAQFFLDGFHLLVKIVLPLALLHLLLDAPANALLNL